MKILYAVPAIALSVLLQAELLDLSPLFKIMADAPVYAIFVWLFFLQNKREGRLIKALIQMSGKKPDLDDE